MTSLTEIGEVLISKRDQVEKVLKSAQVKLKDIHETGRLRISCGHGRPMYYHCSDKSIEGHYISRKNMDLVTALASSDYYKKVIEQAEAQLRWIEETIKRMPKEDLHDIYTNNPERRKLIQPLFLTDEEYVAQWQSGEYEGKGFDENTPEIYTDRGERVRSKSEKIIADLLCRLSIPYKYEFPVKIQGITFHPDFTILNVPKRKEMLLEHFGMMDDLTYCIHALHKITKYEGAGYIRGDRLLTTYETSEMPLNTKQLQQLIERFCL